MYPTPAPKRFRSSHDEPTLPLGEQGLEVAVLTLHPPTTRLRNQTSPGLTPRHLVLLLLLINILRKDTVLGSKKVECYLDVERFQIVVTKLLIL